MFELAADLELVADADAEEDEDEGAAVEPAGREERTASAAKVAVTPVPLVQDEGTAGAVPATKVTAAH